MARRNMGAWRFFFSSRRRHTRCLSDWNSDVCSSDLLRFDEIVAFAELERFVDQRLKNFSSGMQVRLAYSIAIRVPFEILLLDEVLAVGDEAFQQKCYRSEERRVGKEWRSRWWAGPYK